MNTLSGYLKLKFLTPVFLLLVGFYVYSLWGRIPDIDDAWIGELAYWLSEDGQVRSELMRGITLQEDKFVVSNKLFVLLGAGAINLFGFSLYVLKSVSLIFFVLFIFLFWKYTMSWKRIFTLQDFVFAGIVAFTFPWIFKYSFLYRPEMMMMTLGFVAYIFLEKYLEDEKSKTVYLLISGLFLGLTMSTHLNGIILVCSAGVLLIWNKKYWSVFGLGLATIAGFLPYFWDMTSATDFELWRHQFFDSPSLDSLEKGPIWIKPVFNLVGEHMRYFHDLEIIPFSLFVLVCMLIGFRDLLKTQPSITRFSLLVAIFTGLIAMHKSRQYILLNFPYILILTTLTFRNLRENKIAGWPVYGNKRNTFFQTLILVFLAVFFVVSNGYNIKLGIQKFRPEQNRTLTEKYIGEEPSKLNVIAPMTFIFDEIENFNRIQGEVCYIEFQKADPNVKGEGFLQKAREYDVSLIMVTPFYQKILGIDGWNTGYEENGFKVIDKTDQLLVFKRLH